MGRAVDYSASRVTVLRKSRRLDAVMDGSMAHMVRPTAEVLLSCEPQLLQYIKTTTTRI